MLDYLTDPDAVPSVRFLRNTNYVFSGHTLHGIESKKAHKFEETLRKIF